MCTKFQVRKFRLVREWDTNQQTSQQTKNIRPNIKINIACRRHMDRKLEFFNYIFFCPAGQKNLEIILAVYFYGVFQSSDKS